MVTGSSTPATRAYRSSLATLTGAQKTARGVSFYSRHVNRPAGRRVAAAAHVLRMTPNQLTVLSGLLSLSGLVQLAVRPPSWSSGVIAALALAAGYVLDSADGQLARLTGTGSATGELLDHVLDCAIKLLLHAAVLVAWYRAGEPGGLLAAALAFQVVAVLLFFEGTLVGKLREQSTRGTAGSTGAPSRLSGLALLPVDHGTVCWSFLLWGSAPAFAAVYLALLAAHAVVLVALSVRWSAELGATGS